jgi:hypothetical protein
MLAGLGMTLLLMALAERERGVLRAAGEIKRRNINGDRRTLEVSSLGFYALCFLGAELRDRARQIMENGEGLEKTRCSIILRPAGASAPRAKTAAHLASTRYSCGPLASPTRHPSSR